MTKRRKVVIAPIEWDVVDLADSCDFEVVGFFDKKAIKPAGAYPILGGDEAWPAFRIKNPDVSAIIVVDPPDIRARLFGLYGADSILTVISPAAHVSPRSKVGHGSVVQRAVNVMATVELGAGCSVNVGAIIHHEVRVADFCTIGPGAILAGAVVLEQFAYIGAGAIIRQNVHIGCGAKVGAGAVVVEDVAAGDTVMGVPARPRK